MAAAGALGCFPRGIWGHIRHVQVRTGNMNESMGTCSPDIPPRNVGTGWGARSSAHTHKPASQPPLKIEHLHDPGNNRGCGSDSG